MFKQIPAVNKYFPNFMFPRIILGISLVYTLSGCVTTRPQTMVVPPPVNFNNVVTLKSLCDEHQVQWTWDSISQVIVLKANHLEARAMVGSDVVVIGEEKIFLDSPITLENSSIIVPYDFNRKVMARMGSVDRMIPDTHVRKIRTVLIDPGHGGKDPGAIGERGTKEKDVVLGIALELQEALKRQGFQVEMTRDNDEFITLEKRTEIASKQKVDLFISIHANSSKAKRASGIEVYSLRNLSVSEVNSDQRKRNQYLLFRNFSMEPDGNLKSIVSDLLYDHKCFQDDLLASYAAQKLSTNARARNRGDKKSGFFVLKNTIMPSVLIEVGFLSNPKEERLLSGRSYQSKIARSLAQVIIDYNRFSDDELCRTVHKEE